MLEVFVEPVAEEVPPEPEEEPQFADDYDEDEPETPTTADLLVILVSANCFNIHCCNKITIHTVSVGLVMIRACMK